MELKIFTPWICESGHRLEIDGVDGKGLCRICGQIASISTNPESVKEAMALDVLRPVRTVVIKGRVHKLETRECLYCNSFFETTYINAKYCSKKCKKAESQDRENSKRLGVIYCLFCHTEVVSVDKRRKFCGPVCRENMRKT